MKNHLILLATAILLLTSCGQVQNNDVKKTTQLGKSYGPEKVKMEAIVTAAEMLTKFDKTAGDQEFYFEGTIIEVCSKAGCWVKVDDGKGGSFRVMFKDHFTIPTNTSIGTKAYFGGLAYQDTVSVEYLRHYEEDAGKSKAEIEKITEPSIEFGFEADGITLKK
jgi:hypothetical protein